MTLGWRSVRHGGVERGRTSLTPDGEHVGYLPLIVASAAFDRSEVGNTTTTAFAASLGLSNSDVNGNPSHDIFTGTGGMSIVDLKTCRADDWLGGRDERVRAPRQRGEPARPAPEVRLLPRDESYRTPA